MKSSTSYNNKLRDQNVLDIDGLKSAFSAIYRDDAWSNGSGPGSIPQINRPYIVFLEAFVRNNNVRRIIDIGCGDFQLMKSVDVGAIEYIGYDLVPQVIEANRHQHKRKSLSFCEMPSSPEELPEGDLAIVKDVLIHLDNRTCHSLLNALLNKNRFVITVNNRTNDANAYNKEIVSGEFRPVDVSLPPLNFPSATVLRYSRDCMLDPRYPWFVARLLHKYVWPGQKHVQLLLGRASAAALQHVDEVAAV